MSDPFRPILPPPMGQAPPKAQPDSVVMGTTRGDPNYQYGLHAPSPDLEAPVSKSWLFEIVEREGGAIEESFALILPPQAYTIKESQRVSITKTFGNAFIDDYGPDNIQITLKGISGTAHVFPTFRTHGDSVGFSEGVLLGGFGASAVEASDQGYTGRDAFYVFRDTILRYKDREGWENRELRVYDLADEQAYRCILLDFTLDRNSEMPIQRYPFTISLFVYQRLDKLVPVLKPISISKYPLTALNQADAVIEEFTESHRDLPSLSNIAALLNARALELRARWNQALDDVTGVITSPLDIAKNFIDTAFIGLRLAHDVFLARGYTLQRYMNAAELLRDTLNNGLGIYGYQISEGWQITRTVTINEDAGISMAEGTVARGSTPRSYEYGGLKSVTIRGVDTLQSISLRELGDESLWPNLVAVNSEISSNDDIVPGEELFVPVQIEVMEGINKEQFILTEDIARDPYGTDIRLDSFGNIIVQENNDLALISGIENVKQAVNLRLNTEVGSLIKQSAYGITAQAGFAGTSMAIRYLKMSIRSTLIQDPRIESVSDMVVGLAKDTIHVSMNINIVGSERSIPVTQVL